MFEYKKFRPFKRGRGAELWLIKKGQYISYDFIIETILNSSKIYFYIKSKRNIRETEKFYFENMLSEMSLFLLVFNRTSIV